jgi:cytochrome c peroxidase
MAVTFGMALVGCGSGSNNSTIDASGSTSVKLSPAAAAFVSLDLDNLANYAAPALPAYYDATVFGNDNTPAADPVTDKVATLGRVLFFDKRLSVNDTTSCASCHRQTQGFADTNRFSLGFSGATFTAAHSMRLGNIRFYRPGTMFWNKRATSVEAQVSKPIQNSVEMGFDASNGGIAALLTKMQSLPYYPELFTFAFGDSTITEDRIQRAVAQFERSMVSVNSAWDTAYAQVFNPALPDRGLDITAPGFTAQEDRGRHLFMAAPGQGGLGCHSCHMPPSYALDANALGIGLDAGETTIFKAPALKNVGTAGAFMHDGRFATLDQVVEHYSSGVQDGPALDSRLKAPDGTPLLLNLSVADKDALVAFLKTLDDPLLAADAKFSSPFLQ